MKRNKFVAAMEDLIEDTTPPVVVSEDEYQEAVDNVIQTSNDTTEIMDKTDEAISDAETLETVQDIINESVDTEEGLPVDAAQIASECLRNICERQGIKFDVSKMPSLESYSNKNTKLTSTRIAQEAIAIGLAKLWEAVGTATNEMFVGFMETVKDQELIIEVQLEKTKQLKDQLKFIKDKEIATKELSIDDTIGILSHIGIDTSSNISPSDIFTGIEPLLETISNAGQAANEAKDGISAIDKALKDSTEITKDDYVEIITDVMKCVGDVEGSDKKKSVTIGNKFSTISKTFKLEVEEDKDGFMFTDTQEESWNSTTFFTKNSEYLLPTLKIKDIEKTLSENNKALLVLKDYYSKVQDVQAYNSVAASFINDLMKKYAGIGNIFKNTLIGVGGGILSGSAIGAVGGAALAYGNARGGFIKDFDDKMRANGSDVLSGISKNTAKGLHKMSMSDGTFEASVNKILGSTKDSTRSGIGGSGVGAMAGAVVGGLVGGIKGALNTESDTQELSLIRATVLSFTKQVSTVSVVVPVEVLKSLIMVNVYCEASINNYA